MGYQFAGFFASADRSMLQDAQRTWPGCHTRDITAPFHGVGVAVPERALTYGEPEDAYARAIEMWHNIETELPAWSRRYPGALFVFLHADCWGGICYYEGYACQDGAILERAADDEDEIGGGDALRQLARHLGVELGDPPYFEPLSRGYFETLE
jgi:hypothetical protein